MPYEDFIYTWRPDSRLVVIDVPTESLAAPYLQSGDEVLEIGGKPVRRLQQLYSLPLQTAYEYTILREGLVKIQNIPFSPQTTLLAIQLRLPVTILALAGWFVGMAMLRWAAEDNWQALRSGTIFLFSSMAAAGMYAALNGVPGTWIVGYQLVFFLAPMWAYLGFLPREHAVSSRINSLFLALLATASILALVAGYEALYLYPQLTSIAELVGISIYDLGLALAGLGLLACVILLALRAMRLPQDSYLRHQMVLLLAFIGLGTVPIVLFTVLPAILLNTLLLTFQAAIVLMILIPLGYLFVIYRKGLLGLDAFFSRSIHLVLLSLVSFAIYFIGIYLVWTFSGIDESESVFLATLLFFPILLFTIYVSKPVRSFVDKVVYGDVPFGQDVLAEYADTLSMRPESATLNSIVESLSAKMGASRAFLGLKGDADSLETISAIGIAGDLASWSRLERTIVRTTEDASEQLVDHQVLQSFPWAEIVIPVRAREEQIGILALSRPGIDGYFNAKQVAFLNQAARVLAVGSENIALFETARKLSWKRLKIQAQERRDLSRRIHDDPLQRVTYAIFLIDQLGTNHVQQRDAGQQADGVDSSMGDPFTSELVVAADQLRKAAGSLRAICTGLNPPFHDQGVELAVQDVVSTFKTEYGMTIHYDSSIDGIDHDATEQVTAVVCGVLNEALNNVRKHAEGADAWVSLEACADEALILSVADNGPGSRVEQFSFSELVRRHHLGIVGMHEWAQQIGGNLQILSNTPRGTLVKLRCPLGVDAPLA
jgi:signal transduction histidine kinase